MNKVRLSGKTRTIFIVGDPIDQVKSPQGMTGYFQNTLGLDIVVVPARVTAEMLEPFTAGARAMGNCLGLIATIPHKAALLQLCDRSTGTAATVRAANVARFEDGALRGDHVDGQGLLGAARAKCIEVAGSRALLVGAGGAGSAIGHTFLSAGLEHLVLSDKDRTRAEHLRDRLSSDFPDRVSVTSGKDRTDIIINATPLGMAPGDPLMFDLPTIRSARVAMDVVTATDDTPFIKMARSEGCTTVNGNEMFEAMRKPMADFFLG
ncbi:shikimate dehydrogenase family protein [Hoeflea sp.]|uniref:shikimate dehydrogenase family protein n=1 Tax=Hoeflea sp. TaxID=1940281 RepID=UPI003B01878E